MAPSLSNVKLFSTVLSNVVSRRGYAAASQGVASTVSKSSGARSTVMAKKTGEEKLSNMPPSKVSWVPDPKTGCYRPENRADEIDVAELRALLLKQKK